MAPTIVDQQYQIASVESLKPHPLNPNQGDVEFISASLEQTGFWGAILVQEGTDHIIAGEHRWLAAKEKGLDQVPVLVLDVDDARALEIMAMDNRSRDRATWDDQATYDLLKTVEEARLPAHGFDVEDLNTLRSIYGGDDTPKPQAAPAKPAAVPQPKPASSDSGKPVPNQPDTTYTVATADSKPAAPTPVQIQLQLTPGQHDELVAAVQELQPRLGTKGVTETVYAAVLTLAAGDGDGG